MGIVLPYLLRQELLAGLEVGESDQDFRKD